MGKVFIYLLVFCFVNTLYGQDEPGIIETRLRSDSAAYNIKMNTFLLNYRSNRRNILWPYPGSRTKAYDFGLNLGHSRGYMDGDTFEGYMLQGVFGRQHSHSNYTEVSMGSHVLDKRNDEDSSEVKTLLVGGFDHIYGYDGNTFKFSYIHDFMYRRLFLPAGVEYNLIEDRFRLEYSKQYLDNFQTTLGYTHTDISDGNKFNSTATTTSVIFDFYPFGAWTGIAIEYGNSKFLTHRYGSQKEYYTYGPQVGVNYTFYEGLTLVAGYETSKSTDSFNSKSIDTYKFLNVEIGDRNSTEILFSYVRMDSETLEENWFDNQIIINLKYTL